LSLINYNKLLLFHGGDTGSIPVRDAKLEFPSEKLVANLWTEFTAQHGEALVTNRKELQNP